MRFINPYKNGRVDVEDQVQNTEDVEADVFVDEEVDLGQPVQPSAQVVDKEHFTRIYLSAMHNGIPAKDAFQMMKNYVHGNVVYGAPPNVHQVTYP